MCTAAFTKDVVTTNDCKQTNRNKAEDNEVDRINFMAVGNLPKSNVP
jgi:hypothetical protein